MSQNRCDEIGDQLHAFRAGEVSPLARVAIETHLDYCTNCRAELRWQTELENAAKQGPPPLTEAQKHRIVSKLLGDQAPTKAPAPRRARPSFPWIRIAIPSFAAAAAAAMLTFFFTPPEPPEQKIGWLSTTMGVRAFAPERAEIEFMGERDRPRLRIDRKAVLVKYKRPKNTGPLEVETPHASVVVRGTVFFVDVDGGRTVVGVQRGRVEVFSQDGSSAMVHAGEQVETSASGVLHVNATSRQFGLLNVLFPVPAAEEPIIEPVEPPPPAPRRQIKVSNQPDAKSIARVVAKNRWLVQECYQHELKRDSSLRGSIEVELTYNKSGRVVNAAVSNDAMGSPDVSACILDRVKKWKFPRSEQDQVTVAVPFVFTRTKQKTKVSP